MGLFASRADAAGGWTSTEPPNIVGDRRLHVPIEAGRQPFRLAIALSPARPRAGSRFVVRVARRSLVAAVRVCLEPSVGHARCAPARPGRSGTARAGFIAPYPGIWKVRATAGAATGSRAARILPRHQKLVVLVAGDSLARRVASGMKSLRPPTMLVHGDVN